MYKIGDKVRVLSGVFYQGYNLSMKTGIVKDTSSYIIVYFDDIKLLAKMLTDEIESYDDYLYDSDSWRWE